MILAEIYYALKHTINRDKQVCPKCGKNGFQHGFTPEIEYYCTFCSLWTPHIETKVEYSKTTRSDIA